MNEMFYWVIVIVTLLNAVNLIVVVWRLGRLEKRVERLEHPPQHVRFSEGTHDRGFYENDGRLMTLAEYLRRGL